MICFSDRSVEKTLNEDIDTDDKISKKLISEILGNYNSFKYEDRDQWNSGQIPSNEPNSSNYQD